LFLFKLIFFKEGIWSWAFFIIAIILILYYITFSGKLIAIIKKYIEGKDEKEAKEQQKKDQKRLHETTTKINEAVGAEWGAKALKKRAASKPAKKHSVKVAGEGFRVDKAAKRWKRK